MWRVPPHAKPVEFNIPITELGSWEPGSGFSLGRVNLPKLDEPSVARWAQEVVTKATLSTSKDAYVVDTIPLPLQNPWGRNVRLSDIAFFKDGTAAGVTVDGDVWIIRGLKENLGEVHWHRFASGLHEPMSIAIRDEQIYVYDRNGIWRLRDTNGDGEADVHELFSNVFPQSGESREFPMSLKLAPDGSFIVAKGGQQASTISKLNGSVLRVAADGKSYEILGVGFRQPFAGVNPKTGLVTASDQEGNYTPTTPLYIVKGGEYHKASFPSCSPQGSLSRADCRSAHVDSASGQSFRCHASVAHECAHGAAERFADSYRVQSSRTLSCAAQ